ncbi:MAG: sulfatase-like hydrolase/transferase, partial [Planctomycetaceae bacterium]|nr:sulfatase-like hydrolase/transferase [Planctomycetaceae bacterium]
DVIDSLDDLNIANDTFVFFMSDNGAFRLNRAGLDVGINTPLRNGGVTCWEGGLRVPALARYPGHIKPGAVIDEPLWSPDLFVAAVELAAAKLPEDRVFDGKNPLPILSNNESTPHGSFFFQYRNHAALRKGDWKIVREKPDQPWLLFNLNSDPEESRNLAKTHQEKVTELTNLTQRWRAGFPSSNR